MTRATLDPRDPSRPCPCVGTPAGQWPEGAGRRHINGTEQNVKDGEEDVPPGRQLTVPAQGAVSNPGIN